MLNLSKDEGEISPYEAEASECYCEFFLGEDNDKRAGLACH